MKDYHLHIISFDIPYPPSYGGVIDVFYQIAYLSKAGVKIHLHAFDYGKGKRAEELEQLCYSVNYYPRQTGILSALSNKPYITGSRRSEALVLELLKDNHPILFEGLHSCYHISDKRLANRQKIFRETNIEHLYYGYLALAEINPFYKLYFAFAALKLRFYQRVIRHAGLVFCVSETDTIYYKKKFQKIPVVFMPCFHKNEEVLLEKGAGSYILFHGNLEVSENIKAAIYLMEKVMNDIDYRFIIAGNNPTRRIKRIALQHPNVEVIANPDEEQMEKLIKKAHLHLLITFQATGLKLKLLNALFRGKLVVANSKMVHGTGLAPLCFIADTPDELKSYIHQLTDYDYNFAEIGRRRELLLHRFNNKENTKEMINLIYRKD
ncbi:MAG: glycosyltransferase [Bacteroidetes bacterium]|nr:glycosyltransferase [Bacteroidota bacterium]